MERANARERALMEGEQKVIQSVIRFGIEKLKTDPQFAQRAIELHLKAVLRSQENKDAIVRETVALLAQDPPSATDAESGNEALSEEFVTPFERYAESATTEDLRHKWARVLSSEIRRPGTFSTKVLRIVSELDAEVAAIFERFCASLIDVVVPKAIAPLEYQDQVKLVTAGLLVEPGLGQHRQFTRAVYPDGRKGYLGGLGPLLMGISRDAKLPSTLQSLTDNVVLMQGQDCPAFGVFALTDVGIAIATILPNTAEAAAKRFIELARATHPSVAIEVFRREELANFRLDSSE